MVRVVRWIPVVFGVCMLGSGCAAVGKFQAGVARSREAREHARLREAALEAHAPFREQRNWRAKVYRNEELLAMAAPDNVRIEIALDEQRGFLLVHGALAMEFPVATGRRSHPTPSGSFTIRGKEKVYRSNLYGTIYDAEGVVVVRDADTRRDAVPEGGSFEGSNMPYWMRLTDSGVGMHVGYVPGGRTASHGCIRLKREAAPKIFALVKVGTPVTIAETAPVLAARRKVR